MAAINFPSSPANGDTHVVDGVTYTYNSAETKWKTTINSNAFLPLSGGTVSGNILMGGEIQHDGDTDTKITFGTDTINLDTAGSTRATVDSSGRFLVGDTSSAYSNIYFLVAGADNTNYMAMLNTTASDASNSRYSYFHFRGTQSGGEETSLASIGGMHEGTADDAKGRLRFFTNNGTQNNSLSEAMRLDSSQNLQFNSGYGSVATAYGVRAWVNFNGEGTVAIRSSGNVSSITDNGTGNYSVNFTNAMPDTDYVYFGGIGDSTSSYAIRGLSSRQTSSSFSTTSHQFACVTDGNNGFDAEAVTIAFIR